MVRRGGLVLCLAIGAATVAATAWALADRPKRIAPRLDRRAVQRLFDKGD